jgi:cytochrome c553
MHLSRSLLRAGSKGGRLRFSIGSLIAAFAVSQSVAFAATDGGAIMANGVGSAPACAACHGQNGEGQPDAGFPRLAGLKSAYIQQQLKSFADDTRKNDVMKPIASALTEPDRTAIADYLSGLAPPKAASGDAPDPKEIAQGSQIASDGLWSKGVPGCDQCHGPQGQGVGAVFPRLAGQSATYITSQIEAWSAGTRTNDPQSLMNGIAHKLDEADIKAVAAYYASLEPAGSTPAMTNAATGATK